MRKDNDAFYKQNRQYLNQLTYSLRHTPEQVGAQGVLIRTADGYAVDLPAIRVEREP